MDDSMDDSFDELVQLWGRLLGDNHQWLVLSVVLPHHFGQRSSPISMIHKHYCSQLLSMIHYDSLLFTIFGIVELYSTD